MSPSPYLQHVLTSKSTAIIGISQCDGPCSGLFKCYRKLACWVAIRFCHLQHYSVQVNVIKTGSQWPGMSGILLPLFISRAHSPFLFQLTCSGVGPTWWFCLMYYSKLYTCCLFHGAALVVGMPFQVHCVVNSITVFFYYFKLGSRILYIHHYCICTTINILHIYTVLINSCHWFV